MPPIFAGVFHPSQQSCSRVMIITHVDEVGSPRPLYLRPQRQLRLFSSGTAISLPLNTDSGGTGRLHLDVSNWRQTPYLTPIRVSAVLAESFCRMFLDILAIVSLVRGRQTLIARIRARRDGGRAVGINRCRGQAIGAIGIYECGGRTLEGGSWRILVAYWSTRVGRADLSSLVLRIAW